MTSDSSIIFLMGGQIDFFGRLRQSLVQYPIFIKEKLKRKLYYLEIFYGRIGSFRRNRVLVVLVIFNF